MFQAHALHPGMRRLAPGPRREAMEMHWAQVDFFCGDGQARIAAGIVFEPFGGDGQPFAQGLIVVDGRWQCGNDRGDKFCRQGL